MTTPDTANTKPSPVIHWQLVTPDPEAAQSFYTGLFGWTCDDDNALRYRRLASEGEKGQGIGGGIWPAPPEANAFVQLHIHVDDLPTAVERAKELGANVILPPQELPEGQSMAVLHDPQGVPFALTTGEG